MSLAEHAVDRVVTRPKPDAPLSKHTVLIGKLNTSVTLEPAFWNGLKGIAALEGITIGELFRRINDQRDVCMNLSSAARVFYVRHLEQRLAPAQ